MDGSRNVRPMGYGVAMNEIDKAWADVYWTFQEEAFDLSDNHIGRYTCPVPFSNAKYFESYAEVPF